MDKYSDQVLVQKRALGDVSSHDALLLANKDRSVINSRSSNLPKCILLSYILAHDDGGAYRTGYAVFSSSYIYDFLVAKFMKELWKQMVNDDARFDPYLYEAYVRKLFYDNVKTPTRKEYKIKDAVSKNVAKKIKATSSLVHLGGCVGLQQVENIEHMAVTKAMVVFHPYSPTNKLIDFIYRDDLVYNCFQCTIGKDHDARSDHIFDLANFIMNSNTSAVSLPRINIYYAVPYHRFADFVTKPTNASESARNECKEQTGSNSYLYLHWNDIVTVSILCVYPPTDPASQPLADVNEDIEITEDDVGIIE